jgi:glycosyltransferase involved in cell wall biosynthesis
MPDRVLLLTYAFPPMWVPEAALSVKRMASIPNFEVDVICAEPFGQWDGADHSLDALVSERFGSVERIEMPRWALRLPLGRVGLLVRSPDELRFMNRRALRRLRARDLSRYAAIVSWSQWHSVHLVGLRARRLPDAPAWIAHFSDPWVDNPLAPLRGLGARVNRRLEREVVQEADQLLVTSREALELFAASYGDRARRKAKILPHAFEPTLYPKDTARTRDGPFVVRYIGQFYGVRTPEPLFRALARLQSRAPEAVAGLRVEIVGRVEHGMLETAAARSLPQGLVTVRPPVNYAESLRLIADADLLLVIDAPIAESPFLPSKLVDYVGAARPVVGFTPPGPSATLIRRIGGWVANPDDAEATSAALMRGLEWLRANRDAEFGDPHVRREYEAGRVGSRMGELIRELADGSRRADPSK